MLVGLYALLTLCRADSGPDPAGFDLLAASSSSKLKDAPAAAPQEQPDAASGPALEIQVSEPPPVAVVRPTVAAVEVPRLLDPPAVVVEPPPENPAFLEALHQGDRPMIRNLLTLGWTPLLATAMVATPLPVLIQTADAETPGSGGKQNSDGQTPAPDAKALAELTKQIQALGRQITALQADVRGMKSDREIDQEAANTAFANVAKDITAMRKQLADLRRDVDELRQRSPSTSTSAYSPPAPARTGLVHVINQYNTPMQVFVNRAARLLQPGEDWWATVPAGDFTYEILQDVGNGSFGTVKPRQTRTVAPNGSYALTIAPVGV
jgi:hypothetical protein